MYYFGLSPSLCWRPVPIVLINTVTAITIGVLPKTRSSPLCLNPIWGLFVFLIKARKKGSASYSVALITYLRDRDDMRTGSRGKKKKPGAQKRTRRRVRTPVAATPVAAPSSLFVSLLRR